LYVIDRGIGIAGVGPARLGDLYYEVKERGTTDDKRKKRLEIAADDG